MKHPISRTGNLLQAKNLLGPQRVDIRLGETADPRTAVDLTIERRSIIEGCDRKCPSAGLSAKSFPV